MGETNYFLIVFKAFYIIQNSCEVLLTRSKPMTSYIRGLIGGPNAIILLNEHSIKLPLPSSYLHTHRSVYLSTLTREAFFFSAGRDWHRDPQVISTQRLRDCRMLRCKWDINLTTFSPRLGDHWGRRKWRIISTRSRCLQWNIICWAWHRYCTHELTGALTAYTILV